VEGGGKGTYLKPKDSNAAVGVYDCATRKEPKKYDMTDRQREKQTYLDLRLIVPPVPCGTTVDDSSPVGTIAGSSHLVAPVYARHLQIFF